MAPFTLVVVILEEPFTTHTAAIPIISLVLLKSSVPSELTAGALIWLGCSAGVAVFTALHTFVALRALKPANITALAKLWILNAQQISSGFSREPDWA
jgi:hypothetical protein